jgi:hypothetical protein
MIWRRKNELQQHFPTSSKNYETTTNKKLLRKTVKNKTGSSSFLTAVKFI